MCTAQTLVLPKGALMQGPAAIWTGHDVRCPYGGMGGHRNYVFVHGNGSGLVETPLRYTPPFYQSGAGQPARGRHCRPARWLSVPQTWPLRSVADT
jgi:hypothetical protein